MKYLYKAQDILPPPSLFPSPFFPPRTHWFPPSASLGLSPATCYSLNTRVWIKPTLLLWSDIVFPTLALSRIHVLRNCNHRMSWISQYLHIPIMIKSKYNNLRMICQWRWMFGFHHAWIEIPRCHLGHSLKENCPSWRFSASHYVSSNYLKLVNEEYNEVS